MTTVTVILSKNLAESRAYAKAQGWKRGDWVHCGNWKQLNALLQVGCTSVELDGFQLRSEYEQSRILRTIAFIQRKNSQPITADTARG